MQSNAFLFHLQTSFKACRMMSQITTRGKLYHESCHLEYDANSIEQNFAIESDGTCFSDPEMAAIRTDCACLAARDAL